MASNPFVIVRMSSLHNMAYVSTYRAIIKARRSCPKMPRLITTEDSKSDQNIWDYRFILNKETILILSCFAIIDTYRIYFKL